MKNKLLIASFALSGLVSAQCNMKCSYDRLPDGTITHIEGCNENITEMFESSATNYEDIFNRNKTKNCRIKSCLILIANGDTICWNHSKKAKTLIKKQIKEKGSFNHYQYDRPDGSPYSKK
tara:strand:+ start:787 stop:1149 length:363 start_codon:yes stop_codon:yes gene_type:complete